MAVMVTGLIAVWILQLLGAALNDVGRRCFASALDTVVRAAIGKTELTSSLLLLRSTLSEDWQAGDMTEYTGDSLVNKTSDGDVSNVLELLELYCRTFTATRPTVRTIRLLILSVHNMQPLAVFLPSSCFVNVLCEWVKRSDVTEVLKVVLSEIGSSIEHVAV